MCTIFVILKGYLAYNLESISIATDGEASQHLARSYISLNSFAGVNSGIGAVLAISTIAGDLIFEHNENIWYVDSILGCVCAVFLLIYGLW
jgi:hypothetical protein